MPLQKRHSLMLRSAKRNLRRLSYFGLVERQRASQLLFTATFGAGTDSSTGEEKTGITWNGPRFQTMADTHAASAEVSRSQLKRVRKKNALDVKLYAFAEKLFDARIARARQMGLIQEEDGS